MTNSHKTKIITAKIYHNRRLFVDLFYAIRENNDNKKNMFLQKDIEKFLG